MERTMQQVECEVWKAINGDFANVHQERTPGGIHRYWFDYPKIDGAGTTKEQARANFKRNALAWIERNT